MEKNVLVAYGSWAGSTGEIAEMIAKALQEEGLSTSAVPAGEVKDLSPYSAVVVGSGIRAGDMHGTVKGFMKRHNAALQGMPVAYFVSCKCMKQPTPEKIAEAQGYMKPLLEKYPEIKPVSQGMFAGVLDYGKIDWLSGWIMKKIEKDGGKGGDYRNPQAIRAWAREMAAKLN
jgi:menaquinone-dependent protoporphyrinogen oxidase